MKIYGILFIAFVAVSCRGKKCNFETIESGINCACEYSEKIKAVPGQTSDLQDEVKALKEDFESAIESGVFTKEGFINKLKEECPAYLEIIE